MLSALAHAPLFAANPMLGTRRFVAVYRYGGREWESAFNTKLAAEAFLAQTAEPVGLWTREA